MLDNKVILITGGTGSLGQAVTEELLKTNIQSIRIYSRGEYWQAEMKRLFPDKRIRYFIGDVRDKERLEQVIRGVDIVIHVAALKRVETCEFNPYEAIKTNILGSMNVVLASIENKVEKVLGISSDKGVHPINAYGKTKALMESVMLDGNLLGDTKVSCVRCGNFEGSRGSVFPLWEEQAKEGFITITVKEMTRFWITIPVMAQFVIETLGRMEGGELFIPKMPEQTMIELAQKFYPDTEVRIIGNRGNEKLHELLFNEGEVPIDCGDYFMVKK